MRAFLVGTALLAGCQDYGKLQKDFCETAKVKHFVSVDHDGTVHTKTEKAAFCDDFEGTAIDSTKWDDAVDGGTLEQVVLDHDYDFDMAPAGAPSRAYRGHGVLHAVAGPNESAQLIEKNITPAQFAPAVRFFVWPGNASTIGSVTLVEFVDDTGNVIRKVTLENGALSALDAKTGAFHGDSAQLFPSYWSCVEINSGPTRMDVVVDRSLTSASGFSIGPLDPSTAAAAEIRIGVKRGDDMLAPTALWFDEIIIDSDPAGPAFAIGCLP